MRRVMTARAVGARTAGCRIDGGALIYGSERVTEPSPVVVVSPDTTGYMIDSYLYIRHR